jgi:high-affinity K+ transport system ATPase subunit B
MVFSLLFTPLGRYLLIGGLVVLVLGGVYFKIRADAVAEIEAAAQADALRRTSDAIRAGDLVPVSPDRLREADGHNRD